MPEQNSRPPIAFLSYAHRDDLQTGGKITELREALQLAVSSVVGSDFEIFQDTDAIAWGKQWQGRLDEALGQAQFLIPIITPSYFNSAPCRDELEKFVDLERQAGRSDLILPLYFRTIRDFNTSDDRLVQFISRRQYRDWREVRNKPLDDPSIREKVDELADELGEALAVSLAPVRVQTRSSEREATRQATSPALRSGSQMALLGELRARVDKLEEERTGREATIAALQSARTTLQEELYEARQQNASTSSAAQASGGNTTTTRRRDLTGGRTHVLTVASAMATGLVVGGAGVWMLTGEDVLRWPSGGDEHTTATISRLETRLSELGTRLAAEQGEKEDLRDQLAKSRASLDVILDTVRRLPEELYQIGDSLRDCAECPELVLVSAGEFMMGSPLDELGRRGNEGPQHKVTVAEPFWVGKYEVTFAEWDACVAAGECEENRNDNYWGRGSRPVINVSWVDANEYVSWLSEKTGRAYRLLNEAEWEYVARAQTVSPYWWGDRIGRSNANCDGCGSEWDSEKSTAPVGSFRANGFGLFDTAGNVWEWVEDCWNDSYEGAPTDGSTWLQGNCFPRVVRGGAWRSDPWQLRSASRTRAGADERSGELGFRVSRMLNR